ncbi:DEAD/DEAH box helicase family protein, partial [Faecalibaculum rodentium]
RKLYIDLMLENAGWKKDTNWLEEVPVSPMPTKSGKGNADYVLYGQDGKPLAILEAKKTTADLAKGRQQAALYADALEKQYGHRPVIFLSNGVETRIVDGEYPERKIADVYSPRDLDKLFNLRSRKQHLTPAHSSDRIAGRYYQKQAITAVCELLERKKRKALLVMATGSGKTRTAAALIDWLVQKSWVRNVLFLADRKMLVSQAKAAMEANLPDLSVTNLCEDKSNPDARIVVSTYQTIMNCVDTTSDTSGRIFTPGHFDLIVCDEVHRSIYNKYRDIFNYFDAPMVGLTATPKEEVDRNTYQLFELNDGNPTFAYSLEDGVKDHYLVSYETVETGTKFIQEGIHFDDLTEAEQEDYEERFADENGILPEKIDSTELNKTLFNRDTIRKVLGLLMEHGLHVDCGSRLGKTIIFARNHDHAEKILEVFHQEYPEL